MAGACQHVQLLLTGQVDELDGVAGNADGEVGVLFLLGVLHGVQQLLLAKDIHVQVVCALIEVAIQYLHQILHALVLAVTQCLGVDGLGVGDAVQCPVVGQLGHGVQRGQQAVLLRAVAGVGAGCKRGEGGAAIRQRLAAITEEKNALEAERTAKNRAGQEMNENLLNLERAVAKLDQKRATSAMEEKQILDRLWEHYELSHSDAQAQRIELESVPKANRRIGELKRDITALGTPNIGAIDEFQRVNTRYTYLTDQRNDVEKAKGELQNIIGEITEEMTKIFAEQFKLLSESFQTTFQELFGGGTARLELEDEEDILGCGIEIKAQPPGKTLKTISLLSGGEKAFVAIALYFAILKVHPTPFCVMDEIEAALDEANVVRYARYMRRIAGKTQFIVITHRRGTMEEADVLYGVTMQEKGVSRILTINLNDMAKELHIK